jgi:hypothetical protein
MWYDSKIASYGDINYKINKIYCEKHNFDLICSNKKKYKHRHSAWERLPLILEHIEKYDYIIWIDADAFFYIDSANICNIIEKNMDKNFIFSNDIGNKNINTGLMIIKNCTYCIDFIKIWAYSEELYKQNPHKAWWDQGVLIDMINKNISDIKNNCIFHDYGILQEFNLDENPESPALVVHLAGRNESKRVDVSTTYYKRISNA